MKPEVYQWTQNEVSCDLPTHHSAHTTLIAYQTQQLHRSKHDAVGGSFVLPNMGIDGAAKEYLQGSRAPSLSLAIYERG